MQRIRHFIYKNQFFQSDLSLKIISMQKIFIFSMQMMEKCYMAKGSFNFYLSEMKSLKKSKKRFKRRFLNDSGEREGINMYKQCR